MDACLLLSCCVFFLFFFIYYFMDLRRSVIPHTVLVSFEVKLSFRGQGLYLLFSAFARQARTSFPPTRTALRRTRFTAKRSLETRRSRRSSRASARRSITRESDQNDELSVSCSSQSAGFSYRNRRDVGRFDQKILDVKLRKDFLIVAGKTNQGVAACRDFSHHAR